jgi:hypothetical protein
MSTKRAAAVLVVSVLAFAAAPSAQKVELADVLRAAAAYVVKYSDTLQAVGAEEDYLQLEVSGGRKRADRRLRSDVVFVGVGLGRVITFRDSFSKDAHALRPREPRLLPLLQSTDNERLDKAQKLTDESMRHYISGNVGHFDELLAPLALLRTENETKVKFKLENVKTVGGMQVATLRFAETTAPHVINSPIAEPATGQIQVEVATGIVRQTLLIISDKTINLRSTVVYALDPDLKLWLPSKMSFDSDISAQNAGDVSPNTVSAYNVRESLQGQATYSNYQQVPVKLNVRIP